MDHRRSLLEEPSNLLELLKRTREKRRVETNQSCFFHFVENIFHLFAIATTFKDIFQFVESRSMRQGDEGPAAFQTVNGSGEESVQYCCERGIISQLSTFLSDVDPFFDQSRPISVVLLVQNGSDHAIGDGIEIFASAIDFTSSQTFVRQDAFEEFLKKQTKRLGGKSRRKNERHRSSSIVPQSSCWTSEENRWTLEKRNPEQSDDSSRPRASTKLKERKFNVREYFSLLLVITDLR